MRVPIDEVVHFEAVTSHPSTGAATDADSTPTFAVYEEDTDTDIGVGGNLTKRTAQTGEYRGSFTASAANGFEAGKWYSVIVSATVNSVAGKARVMHFYCVPAEVAAGVPGVNATYLGGTSQTGRDIGASVLLSSGTGTGQVSLSSGTVTVGTNNDKTGYSLTNLTVTAGTTLGAGTHTAQTGDAYAYLGTNLGAAGAAATEAGGTGDQFTGIASVGAVAGSVGSVTGAVGSVTGNVGGNVVGSVASVTGAVGSVTGSVGSVVGHTAQTGDTYALAAGANGFAAIKTDTGNLVTRITATLFSGITSLAEWLGLIAGKQTPDATALTEIKATGAGSGTYDATTDSNEAIRDRGDAAWTGGGAATLTEIRGVVTRSGSTYYVSFVLIQSGAMLTSGLSSLVCTFYDEDGTDLTFSGTPTESGGIIYATGTLGTALSDNRPLLVKVGATYSTVAYSSVLPASAPETS